MTQVCQVGDLFFVPQTDGKVSVGQLLDYMMPNVVSCALYDLRFLEPVYPNVDLMKMNPISCISITKELLISGRWRVIGRCPLAVDKNQWPNEKYRAFKWVGAKVYGAGIVERFLNAFYSLEPWDAWHDPNYLDKLLISPDMKPKTLILNNSVP